MLKSIQQAFDRRSNVTIQTTNDQGQTQLVLVFDAVLEENHSQRTRVTDYPIEDGSAANDHVIQEPVELSLRGMVSNHPIRLLDFGNLGALATTGVLGAFGAKPQVAGTAAYSALAQSKVSKLGQNLVSNGKDPQIGMDSPSGNRAKDAYDVLREKQERGILLTITTGLRVYKNMLITGMTTVRDSKTAHAWVPSIQFKQVEFKTAESVQIAVRKKRIPVKGQVADSAKKTDKKGGNSATDAEKAAANGVAGVGRKSRLTKMSDWIAGFAGLEQGASWQSVINAGAGQ